MAANMTFGEIETVVRRDLIKDDDSEKIRWSSFQVFAAICRGVLDTVKANAWAEFDMDTFERTWNGVNRDVVKYCEDDPSSLATRTSYVVGETTMTVDEYLAYVRALPVGIDDRWHDAVAYFAAFHILDTDGGDIIMRSMANTYIQIAKENAAR